MTTNATIESPKFRTVIFPAANPISSHCRTGFGDMRLQSGNAALVQKGERSPKVHAICDEMVTRGLSPKRIKCGEGKSRKGRVNWD